MKPYLFKRLIAALITLLGVSLLVFLMTHMLPGDPARTIAGPQADDVEIERIRVELGLDRPAAQQYGTYLTHLVQGDLGRSARSGAPVLQEIGARLPYSIKLAILSIVLSSAVGVAAGVLAATRRNSLWDWLVSFGSLIGVSMPVFWMGLLLIIIFAVKLQVLPAAGADDWTSYILPSVTLASFSVALVTRMTRAAVGEVLVQDYVRTARAKGLPQRRVTFKHALRNALIPIVTVIGLQFGSLLGGAVLTESVFGWPGMGQLLVESIFSRDFPMVQGIVLLFSATIILISLGVDLLYAYIDPRIRYG